MNVNLNNGFNPNNQNQEDIFGMLNNLMVPGMGGFFGEQMGGINNINNIFSQFGNMGGQQMNSNLFVNNQNLSNNLNEQFTQNEAEQNQEYNNSEEDEENQEELEKRYIELRNSVINQLPRYKFGAYKAKFINKEVLE